MSIIKFSSIEEVVKRANDTVYGASLTRSAVSLTLVRSRLRCVHPRRVPRAHRCEEAQDRHRVGQHLRAFHVFQQRALKHAQNVIEPAIPWGGFKQSGHGRDMSEVRTHNWRFRS